MTAKDHYYVEKKDIGVSGADTFGHIADENYNTCADIANGRMKKVKDLVK